MADIFITTETKIHSECDHPECRKKAEGRLPGFQNVCETPNNRKLRSDIRKELALQGWSVGRDGSTYCPEHVTDASPDFCESSHPGWTPGSVSCELLCGHEGSHYSSFAKSRDNSEYWTDEEDQRRTVAYLEWKKNRGV